MKLPIYHPEFADFFKSASFNSLFGELGISLKLRNCTLYTKASKTILPVHVKDGLLRCKFQGIKKEWSFLDVINHRINTTRPVKLVQEQLDCVYLIYFNKVTGTDFYGVVDNW